jgi:putative addiction module component (TIGR02574 family)
MLGGTGHKYISSTEAYQLQVIDSLLDELSNSTRLVNYQKTVNLLKINVFMSAATKLKQINDYLIQLNDKQMNAVLTVVKTFAEEQENELWEDKAFIAELDRRTTEYENGRAKVLTLDEIEARVRKGHKSKGKSKR